MWRFDQSDRCEVVGSCEGKWKYLKIQLYYKFKKYVRNKMSWHKSLIFGSFRKRIIDQKVWRKGGTSYIFTKKSKPELSAFRFFLKKLVVDLDEAWVYINNLVWYLRIKTQTFDNSTDANQAVLCDCSKLCIVYILY